MRIGHQDRFYVVVDPSPASELADIFFACDFHDLELQIKGGLTHERRPAIFTDRDEAELEAQGRLMAFRAAETLLRWDSPDKADVDSIQVFDAKGRLLCEAKVSRPGDRGQTRG